MESLRQLVGLETSLTEVSATLRECVKAFVTPVVGAHHVVCSDESEVECVDVFQRVFVEPLLPALGPEKKSAFRTSNLGARYEPGAARVAEHHFATPDMCDGPKCVLIKINGHVSVARTPEGIRYGPMLRYGTQSQACGALHALLAGAQEPFARELRETFATDGNDRIATLLDEQRVDPTYRYLIAALVSARLQAARALQDVRDHQELTPTMYLIVPCVTLNRTGPDTEIICGYCTADYRAAEAAVEYAGLGDEPGDYRILLEGERLRITYERGETAA